MLHAIHGAESFARGWIGDGCCEAIDADLHCGISGMPSLIG